MNDSRRPCPVCDSLGERRVLLQQRFAGETAVGSGYDVVVCANCGAGFADGIPTQADLDQYYRERSKYEYAQSGGVESPYDFQRFQAIVDQAIPFIPSLNAWVVDVGCATGGLLASLSRRGYRRLLGTDPSPQCCTSVRQLYGVEARVLTIAEFKQLNETFDCIFLVGVLEHLADPYGAVEILRRALRPGGWIYCAQPDVGSFDQCYNAPFQQFSTEHLNFFSEISLCRLFSRAGCRRVHTWNWMLEWREGITDSVLSGIFQPDNFPQPESHDTVTIRALDRYISLCQREVVSIQNTIDSIADSGEAIFVWGAGTFTRRLLVETRLAQANILSFIDSSPAAQAGRLAGRAISGPSVIGGRPERILISSQTFQAEIARQIRDDLGLTNPIIYFFPVSQPPSL